MQTKKIEEARISHIGFQHARFLKLHLRIEYGSKKIYDSYPILGVLNIHKSQGGNDFHQGIPSHL